MTIDFNDKNLELNENLFDKEELFDYVEELLGSNHIPIDDFKGNISYRENESFSDIPGDFEINCHFAWIFYYDDITEKQFKKKSLEIESLLQDHFKELISEVDCYKYVGNSEYTEDGYDVELRFRLNYKLKEN